VVKQLRRLDTPLKQDAEVALYLKQFDEAEALYRRMDRPDLAVDMRMHLGDWFAVSHTLKALYVPLCAFPSVCVCRVSVSLSVRVSVSVQASVCACVYACLSVCMSECVCMFLCVCLSGYVVHGNRAWSL